MVVLSNFPPPTDGIRHEQPSTTVHINDREIGIGTLFIAERLVYYNLKCITSTRELGAYTESSNIVFINA
jgi:hypothetical protein